MYATAGKNKDRNSGNYQQAERDGHIHHPRSFEYRVVLVGKNERRERGERERERTKIRGTERKKEHVRERRGETKRTRRWKRGGEAEEKNRVGGREKEGRSTPDCTQVYADRGGRGTIGREMVERGRREPVAEEVNTRR